MALSRESARRRYPLGMAMNEPMESNRNARPSPNRSGTPNQSGDQKRHWGSDPTTGQDAEVDMVCTNRRIQLNPTRNSVTHRFTIGGCEGYLTIGLFEDGSPGEVFIKIAKEGSTLSGLMQGFCRAFSLALQYGLPLEDAVRRFRGMSFEPMGKTGNPDVPEASSILDYVAKFMEVEFIRGRGRFESMSSNAQQASAAD